MLDTDRGVFNKLHVFSHDMQDFSFKDIRIPFYSKD